MISLIDWIMAAGYLVAFFAIIWFYAFFRYNQEQAKQFIWLYMVRIIGGILFAVIYVYYFKGVGDTIAYWEGGYSLTNVFFDDPVAYFALLNSDAAQIDPEYMHYVKNIVYYDTAEEWFTVKIVSVVGFLCFKSLLLFNLFFGLIGAFACWQFMRFVNEFIPEINRAAFYVLTCVPGILIWSSGLLKDTITLACFAVFLLYYCKLVLNRDNKLKYYLILIISGYIMFRVKPYVLICEVPSLALATYVFYKSRIKVPFLRRILMPALLMSLMLVSLAGVVQIAEASEKYRLDNLERQVKGFQSWHQMLGGSYYTLGGGHVEYTPVGVIKVAPEALSHTYIRPFLWESRSVSMLLSAVEGTLILVLLLISVRYYIMDFDLRKFLHNHPVVTFLFVFSIIFGFTVGFTSYNYGALARYKVPSQICFLFLLFYIVKKGREFKHKQ